MANDQQSPLTPSELVYIALCQRKFWLYRHGIRPEFEDQNVQIGRTITQTTFSKNKHEIPLQDFGVLDAAVLKNGEIHEIKKSSRRKDLDEIQVAAYLQWLHSHNIPIKKATIHYPTEKKTIEVELTPELEAKLSELRSVALSLSRMDEPPIVQKISACRKCSYQDYCFDEPLHS